MFGRGSAPGALAVLALIVAAPCHAQSAPDPAAALERMAAAAETGLRQGELQIAESHYRSALMAGWMLIGALRIDERRFAEARDAFVHASTSAVDAKAALRSLSIVHLEMGEAARAVSILTRLAGTNPKDVQTRRLLAQALVANGQPDQAIQELEEASGATPSDLELKFALASLYLQRKTVNVAERLFAELTKARPLPQTYVLIGRTYRDAGQYDRARGALETALKLDPRVRRAHYYLGTIAVLAQGVTRLDEAIAEFRQELRLAPDDPATNLRLGMALVEARRDADALPVLMTVIGSDSPPPDAYYYLGRCQVALGRAADAVVSLGRALERSEGSTAADFARLRSIHYQLGLAQQTLGATTEAARHFAEAEQFSARRAAAEREQLSHYLADTERNDPMSVVPILELSAISALTPAQRTDLERRSQDTLARAYLNLGVMQAQKQRFSRAAEFFEYAAGVDAAFPQVQYSLGVAYFNAQQYEKAAFPLARAAVQNPADADIRRMLALAYLNTEAYGKAVELLRDDPRRGADPSLQYAYGLALVRAARAEEAEAVFARLLAEHGDTPELMVLVGQAHAQQGDYDGAIESLKKALQRQPNVADANATLGLIYFKQGRLAEAERALREELATHSENIKARHTLAAVLDLEGQPDEALRLLRMVLSVRPGFVDATYLLGKILLEKGETSEAIEHLEAAVRLAPDEANVHYQLGQAYQKLGRTEDAQKQFENFRQLKDKRRGSIP